MSALKPLDPRASALSTALRDGADAAAIGFDWPHARGVMAKVREELGELEEALERADGRADAAVRHELGDLLMALCSLARKLDLDPESALAAANGRFQDRFHEMEATAAALGTPLEGLGAEALDQLWRDAKARLDARCRPGARA